MRSADEGAGRAIGLGCHATCVHYDYVASEGLPVGNRAQMAGDGLAISTCRTATEVLDEKTRHCPSLMNLRLRGDWSAAGQTI